MRLKHLESALSGIQRDFPNPDVTLEQYPSSPELAAAVVWTALERGDVGNGQTVLDLGCGTGMLAAAAACVDSDHVYAVDCDESALLIAQQNLEELELEQHVSFILAKVKSPGGKGKERRKTTKKNKGRTNNTRSSTQEVRDRIMSDGADDGIPLTSKCVDTGECFRVVSNCDRFF